MDNLKALVATLTEMYNKTKELKAGARHSMGDMEMLQDIHDLSGELGAKHKNGEKKAGEFTVSHRVLMQTFHDHAVDLGADCKIGTKAEDMTDQMRSDMLDEMDDDEMRSMIKEMVSESDEAKDMMAEKDLSEMSDTDMRKMLKKMAQIEEKEAKSGTSEGAVAGHQTQGHDTSGAGGGDRKQLKFLRDLLNEKGMRKADRKIIEKKMERISKKILSEEPSTKSEESLDDKVNKIRSAFYEAFNKPSSSSSIWCREVFEDSIIVDAGEDGMFRIGYTVAKEGITFDTRDKWQKVEQEYVPVKSGETLVGFGGEIKARADGHYGDYLVRFSDQNNADVGKDFFDKKTDFVFSGSIKSPVYLHHCLPVKTGDGVRRITQAIGEATLTLTDDGVAIDAELYDWLIKSHDAYVSKVAKTVKAAIKAGKMGWSSGTASHLVERTKVGESYHIDKWPLGLDATITYAPAGIKQGVGVVEIKSINPAELEEPETGSEAGTSGDLVAPEPTQSQQQKQKEGFKMDPKEIQAIADAVKTSLKAEDDAKRAADEKAKSDKEAMKAVVLEVIQEATKGGRTTNAGGVKTKAGAPGIIEKTELGDDAHKAFNYWLKTGDPTVLRDRDAERQNPDMLDPERAMKAIKTDYNLVGDTQYQGLELVPLEVVRAMRELRDKQSVARLAGATVLPVGAVTNYVPIEKSRTGRFVIQSAQSAEFDDNTVQLIDRATLTVYDFTRTITIARQLLSDSVTNLETWWNRHVARAEAVTENYYFVSVGTGSAQPKSALVGSALGVTAASATAITAAEMVKLYHSVPQQYRNKLATVVNGTTAGVIRGLAAAYGFSFIPTPAGTLQGGNINGDEWLIAPTNKLFEEDDIPAMTTGLKSVLVGNFEEYLIGDREALSVFRDPYSRAKYGDIAFHCFFRRGGTTWTNEAFKHLIQA